MDFTHLLLNLFIILTTAKIFGWLSQKAGQAPVLGELLGGVIIGSSVLGLVKDSETLHFFAELGAVLLLFEIGVTSNLYDFLKMGFWSLVVAIVGVTFPFLFGYLTSLYFGMDTVHSIFIGAILTATSVGITARVFSDLGKLATKEAQIVLGAAVIDDVIGLAILAVVTKLVTDGSVSLASISSITVLSLAFLGGSILVGALLAPTAFKYLKDKELRGLVIVSAFSICLFLAYLASLVGLAPIVGAFSAGLILSITEKKTHIEEQIKPVSDLFVPVFFVLMGALVDIRVFNPFFPANIMILQMAGALFLCAVIGKVISGYAVLEKNTNRLLIGTGMIPRGEVGLIFAGIGMTRKIITPSIYSAAVVVIILTTFVTPFLLKILLKEK